MKHTQHIHILIQTGSRGNAIPKIGFKNYSKNHGCRWKEKIVLNTISLLYTSSKQTANSEGKSAWCKKRMSSSIFTLYETVFAVNNERLWYNESLSMWKQATGKIPAESQKKPEY